MFREIDAKILNEKREVVGNTNVTLQPMYNSRRWTDKGLGISVQIDIEYKAYCDYSALIDSNSYLKIDDVIYKVVEPKAYDTHVACMLYKYEVV